METPAQFRMKGNVNVINLTHAHIFYHIHMELVKLHQQLDRKNKGSPQNIENKSSIYMKKPQNVKAMKKEISACRKLTIMTS